jgi:hypothetical protein
MPYWGAGSPNSGWGSTPPWELTLPATPIGDAIRAVHAALTGSAWHGLPSVAHAWSDEVAANQPLDACLPTLEGHACLAAAVAAAMPGIETLGEKEREILQVICLRKKRLCTRTRRWLQELEAAEGGELDQPVDSGDPLRGKFTQYSPNSAAHCRDCQCRLEEGAIRVGAHVFSSSARHAATSINYWCLACMCARPSTRRQARLNPAELERILPGAALLSEQDVRRVCERLGVAAPDEGQRAAQATGRRRATRSGRKFGSWGGDGGGDG